MRFQILLRAAGMPPKGIDLCSGVIHGIFEDYNFLIEHFKLLEADMIAVLTYLVVGEKRPNCTSRSSLH